MNTPFGPAINLGNNDNPNFAGSAGGVAYLRGIATALQVINDLDVESDWDPHYMWGRCSDAVEALLPAPSTPSSASGRDPNHPADVHVALSNNPEKRDRT